MNAELHLDLLINRAYFDDPATYRTLMAHKAVVVAERERNSMKTTELTENPEPSIPTGPSLSERLRVWYANWKARHIAKAFRVLEKAMRDDPNYAHSWKANISMAIYDEARAVNTYVDPYICQNAANRFMKNCFGVDTSGEP